jgi:hypothetical protein
MSRIRTVKPELFRHELLDAITQSSGLPIGFCFIGLFTCADREGRFRWKPKQLKLDVLPYSELDFEVILNVLVSNKFLTKYTVDGEEYACFTNWHKHQIINNRERASELPPPPGLTAEVCSNVTMANNPKKQKKPMFHVDQAEIMRIFEHWKCIMKCSHAKFDSSRQRCIQKALEMGYSVDELCRAIEGCNATPYNMGHNDFNQKYNSIQLIFRHADQIERFIQHYYSPPTIKTKADQLTKTNVDNMQAWLAKIKNDLSNGGEK